MKDEIYEVMERLGITAHQLQTVKLGPGVVGRNSSIGWALEVVMLAGVICGGMLHSPTLVGLSLCGAILVALVVTLSNVHFGKKNAAAALLEGAQFLQFHQMQMTAATGGAPTPGGPAAPPPPELQSAKANSLPEKSDGGR